MAGRNYYMVTALPSLGQLGTTPPLTIASMLEHVAHRPIARVLVETLFLADDLLQRDAMLAGELEQAQPAVLTNPQLSDEQPLPAYLAAPEQATPRRVAADAVWADYFQHAADVAKRTGCRFLGKWVGFEVALRNALVAERAKALDLDVHEYLVEPQLAAEADLATTINEWAAAPNPLAGMKVLDQARWRWLNDNDAWYSFVDDELAAYAARLMLLHRWDRSDQSSDGAAMPEAAKT